MVWRYPWNPAPQGTWDLPQAPKGQVAGVDGKTDVNFALHHTQNTPGPLPHTPSPHSATSRGSCRGPNRDCCGRLHGTRQAGHNPPPGPVGCGGDWGTPPCASHRAISALERPSPAMGGTGGLLRCWNELYLTDKPHRDTRTAVPAPLDPRAISPVHKQGRSLLTGSLPGPVPTRTRPRAKAKTL